MSKFDISTGLSKNEISSIKFILKREIMIEIPELPEEIEEILFLQGSSAWMFGWNITNKKIPVDKNENLFVEVTVKLKRKFHKYSECTQLKFLCKVKVSKDTYRSKVSIRKIL